MGVLTTKGNWTYFRPYYVVCETLKDPHERFIYYELQRLAVAPAERRSERFDGDALELRENQLVITLQRLSVVTGIPKTTVFRCVRELEKKRVVRVLEKSRGRAGGLLLELMGPDSIPSTAPRRAARLKQLISAIESRPDWEKDPVLTKRRNELKHSLEQIGERIIAGQLRFLLACSQRLGTKTGMHISREPKIESDAENESSAAPEGFFDRFKAPEART